ncbi:MAG: NACalpha-BTF3-like Transcription factor [Candidatus Methanohalarchaeum thermophilum]|uniref:Nascent polypeptide-associated complex protein n=1 Tax=Methanohalarchaeum thermophilum TaxID=1903181 RepID=A0A1Q6DU00_METT1|nr:MAG: NACalpha-BTF3-like Transcription factor [Candidatus Methanohalarchaeum thermophilum]
MFPGGRGGLNPQKMSKMMKQMGIDIDELEDVEEVVIKQKNKELVFNKPKVVKMDAKGQEMYQIVGEPEETGEQIEEEYEPNEEDISLVVEQANSTEEEAKEELKKTDGDIAKAIVNLKD